MPRKKFAPLPDELSYLQPYANLLATLPAEVHHEDVDSTLFVDALLDQLRGLDEEAAARAVARDCEILKSWVDAQSAAHPAHLILGLMRWPGLLWILMHPPEPQPEPPTIQFDVPAGWTFPTAVCTQNLFPMTNSGTA